MQVREGLMLRREGAILKNLQGMLMTLILNPGPIQKLENVSLLQSRYTLTIWIIFERRFPVLRHENDIQPAIENAHLDILDKNLL